MTRPILNVYFQSNVSVSQTIIKDTISQLLDIQSLALFEKLTF